MFAGLGLLLQWLAGSAVNPSELFERFMPPHDRTPGRDPFATVEAVLGKLVSVGRSLSLVAIPAFLWFSTRLFAGIRTSLNAIYDVGLRPAKRHFLLRFVLAKVRDLWMVLLTLTLFVANTAVTFGATFLRDHFESGGLAQSPIFRTLEGWVGGLLALLFSVVLFFLVYRHASLRRVGWQAALIASVFMAIAFEIAKRLYAVYLQGATGYGAAAVDATIGAVLLFVAWIHFSSLVFLLGGVIAETWELRQLQRVQRGGLVRSSATANIPIEQAAVAAVAAEDGGSSARRLGGS